jgi:DNA-binding MarR family transcriptional regulator
MVDYEAVSYVIRSDYRRKLLFTLYSRKSTPSNLAEETDLYPSHVSTTLSELSEKDLVKRLVDSPKGRIYTLTKKGEEVAEEIEKEGL